MILAALLGCTSVLDDCVTTPGPTQALPELDAWLETRRHQDGLVGIAAVVAGPDGLEWSGAAGWENLEDRVPVDPAATLFRWASVSKGIAGVVASGLADEGLVDLDADIPAYEVPATWLDGCKDPECEAPIPEEDRHVTLRRLLTHTSGVMHYQNGQGYGDPPWVLTANPAWNTGMEWALEYWRYKPLIAVPGAEHSYSSYAYNLAGVAMEHLTGEPFWTLAREGAVLPAGACTLQPDYPWALLPRRARGYARLDGHVLREPDTDITWKLAAAGFLSTVEDFGRWCDALVHERVLAREVLDEHAWAEQVPTGGGSYGFGFYRNRRHGQVHLAHSGGQNKAMTFLSIYPDAQRCFAVMSNSTWAPIGDIERDFEDAWLAATGRDGP